MGSETFISPNHPFGGFSFIDGYLFITRLLTALVKRASRETTAINPAIVKQTRERDSDMDFIEGGRELKTDTTQPPASTEKILRLLGVSHTNIQITTSMHLLCAIRLRR